MPTLSQLCGSSVLVLLAVCSASQAQDLHIKKNISAGGYVVSTTETSIKGTRERSVTQSANGSTVTLRQCDLRRTVTMDEANQTYFVADDPQDENAAKAAALATGSALPDAKGGKITVTTTITDTGERKVIYGYQARHLKAKVTQEPSADACTQVRQSFEIDGWFADLAKEQASCATIAPPVQPGSGCHDKVLSRFVGSGSRDIRCRKTSPCQRRMAAPQLSACAFRKSRSSNSRPKCSTCPPDIARSAPLPS